MPHKFRPHERPPAGELPPPTVAWLHPLELLRTAYHAWLSRVATSYLDRREMLAALDRQVPDEDTAFVHSPPLLHTSAPSGGDPFLASGIHSEGGLWIDFLADVGDSWEATHAVATLVARRELTVAGYRGKLPHADLVVLGGDLVYPSPTRDSYRRRTRGPIGSAFPTHEVPPDDEPNAVIRRRRMVAIPGNHDWYDGLTSFVREFCQRGWLGGWQLIQQRSYFALKLMRGWWIFGIDIALDTRIDPAQQAYFNDVLADSTRFERGDNVILCTAKPSWLRSSRYTDDSYKNLEFFVRDLIGEHGGYVAVILSGDLHHYARYADDDGHQLITSGSGGSYLMGTHHLPAEVQPFRKKHETDDEPPSFSDSAFVRCGLPYPSRSDSRRLARRAALLAFRRANIPFCVTVGLNWLWIAWMVDRVAPGLTKIQTFAAKLAATPEWRLSTLAITTAVIIVGGCALFASTANRRARRWQTLPWGALHGLVQIAAAVMLTLLLTPHALEQISQLAWPYIRLSGDFEEIGKQLSTLADGIVFVLLGGWTGATLVGIYLTVSDLLLRWHDNEVFASQSVCDYRSFVRIHVGPGNNLTIYPIGLRHVPRKWRSRLGGSASDPHYEPTDAELLPHLIEGPVAVKVSNSAWPAGQSPVLGASASSLSMIG